MPVKGHEITPDEVLQSDGAAYIAALQQSPAMWSDIPLLNYTPVHELKDLSLVRFRGMVQNMLDPEMYLERYEVQQEGGITRMQEGKYRDCLLLNEGERVNYESAANVKSERRTLCMVSIPGLNDWAREYEEQCNSKSAAQSAAMASGKKRPATSGTDATNMEEDTSNADSSKRCCTEEDQLDLPPRVASSGLRSKVEVLNASFHINSLIPERPGKACMVKIYSGFDDYALNTIIDVVGFLSVDSSLDMFNMKLDTYDEYEGFEGMQVQNPPPHVIPRLHAIAVRRMPHLNPLLDESLLPVLPMPPSEEVNMAAVHQELHQLLTRCLFNDEVASDYLLSHLISTVYNRTDTDTVGHFALNLFNLPIGDYPEYTKKLYQILELLLPASHYLPMKLETMNTAPFIPKKDYRTDKLVSGLLQLAPHTHLVLDEMYLTTGVLQPEGVRCIRGLTQVMQRQQIKCDFQYYEMDYDVDIPILTLGEQRSTLPHHCSLPVKMEVAAVQLIMDTLSEVREQLQPDRLDRFRRYLTMAKKRTFKLNSVESEMVQNDFVEMRRADQIKSAKELHLLLVLSRLLGIARGKDALDKDSWQMAKRMEAAREERFKELPRYQKRLFVI